MLLALYSYFVVYVRNITTYNLRYLINYTYKCNYNQNYKLNKARMMNSRIKKNIIFNSTNF